MAESGDMEAHLSWQDMNLSGTFDFDFTNGMPTNSIVMNGEFTSFAGERYDIAGDATVESMQVFNMGTGPVTVTVAGFAKQGALFNSDPLYTMEVELPVAKEQARDLPTIANR